MGAYTIKNWDRFQHYKKRKPPWIKFYTEVIEEFKPDGEPNDLFFLSDSAKLTLLLAWLLASHFDGVLPDRDGEWYSHRMGILTVNFKELIDKGFLSASNVDSTKVPSTLAPETENRVILKDMSEATTPPTIKKRGRPATTDPRVLPLVKFFGAEFERTRGIKPLIAYGRVVPMFKGLLGVAGEEEIRATVTFFFSNPTPFSEDNTLFEPEYFVKSFNKTRLRMKESDL